MILVEPGCGATNDLRAGEEASGVEFAPEDLPAERHTRVELVFPSAGIAAHIEDRGGAELEPRSPPVPLAMSIHR